MTRNDAEAVGPKHRWVAEAIREGIARGEWGVGDRILSEQEIARRHGVAYMTARHAVSSLVAEGVLERVPRRGTFVLPPRAPRHQDFVLLIQGGTTALDPYYLPPIVESFAREIEAHGHGVAVHGYTNDILAGPISLDTTLCCVLLSEPEALCASLLRERGNRVCAINRWSGGAPYVAPDNFGGAVAAVQHLADLGHRRIGFVRGLQSNIDADERRRGYVHGLRSRGLAPGPEFGSGFVEEVGHDAARQMLALDEPPTAIFCSSDLSAIGAMKAVAEAGLSVPDDVSIVGFGDFPVAKFLHPGLTTVRLPLGDLGTAAARTALALSVGETVEESELACPLVVRETTQRAASEASLSA